VRGASDSGSSSLRPNPLALLAKGGDDEGSDEEGEAAEKVPKSGEFYRAPKMAAAPYKVKHRHTHTLHVLFSVPCCMVTLFYFAV
jgi:hypothetical protein